MPSLQLTRATSHGILKLLIAGLLVVGCGGGCQTVVENHSGAGQVIVSKDEYDGDRVYAVPDGATVVVDDTGESNPPANEIVVLGTSCSDGVDVAGDYSRGGVILIGPTRDVTFEPVRTVPGIPRFLTGGDEDTAALSSCDAAVKALQ